MDKQISQDEDRTPTQPTTCTVPVSVSMTKLTSLAAPQQHDRRVILSPLGVGHHEQARRAVDDERQREQHQAEFDQGAAVKLASRFGEFVGDHRGDRIARRQQRSLDLRIVADDHRHGHGFTERARQREKNRAHDALTREWQHGFPRGFPARRAQRQSRFSLIVGTAQNHFARNRNDERHDHHGEHHARRE